MKEGFKKNKHKKIKAILFDYNGVLVLEKNIYEIPQNGHKILGIHEDISNKLKVPLDQWIDAIDTVYAKSIEGKISKKKLLKIISKNLNIPSKNILKIIIKSYQTHFKKNKFLFSKISNLKKLNYKIGILSDQWPLSKQALISKTDYPLFNFVMLSCDVGARKPDLKIYKLALKKLKLPPQEVLFIDNQKWNISPAKKLGMKTILFKNNEDIYKNNLWKNLLK